MSKLRIFFSSLILCLFLIGLAPQVQSNTDAFLDRVHEVVLPNGMKFLLFKRPGAPVFSAYLRVKAGGFDEREGETGIAHLLEHMAFKGTSSIGTTDPVAEKKLLDEIEEVQKKLEQSSGAEKAQLQATMKQLVEKAESYVVKEQFSNIYNRNGATDLNATTSQDETSYFVSLPNTKLELWAFLESSRLKDPVFREFYTERDVVREERRTRVDDSAFGDLYEALMGIAFEKSPYRRPTIGYPKDIEKLSASKLKEFYDRYYVPKNIVGAVVGDIDLAQTEQILRKYFGNIPSRPAPEAPKFSEPQPTAAKKIDVPFDASPAVMLAYLKPTMPHRDDFIFDVVDQLLCEDPTSRLYKRLVEQDHIVQKVSCSPSTPGGRADNLFFVYASLIQGHSTEEFNRVFNEEVKKILEKGVTDDELKKAKKSLISDWYYEMQSNEDLAEMLSYFESLAGTYKYIQEHQKQIASVNSADVQRVLKTYLAPERARMAILQPTKKKP